MNILDTPSPACYDRRNSPASITSHSAAIAPTISPSSLPGRRTAAHPPTASPPTPESSARPPTRTTSRFAAPARGTAPGHPRHRRRRPRRSVPAPRPGPPRPAAPHGRRRRGTAESTPPPPPPPSLRRGRAPPGAPRGTPRGRRGRTPPPTARARRRACAVPRPPRAPSAARGGWTAGGGRRKTARRAGGGGGARWRTHHDEDEGPLHGALHVRGRAGGVLRRLADAREGLGRVGDADGSELVDCRPLRVVAGDAVGPGGVGRRGRTYVI